MRRPGLVKVVGDSMAPTLLPGDRCYVVPYAPGAPGVVVAESNGLVVKRIGTVWKQRGHIYMVDLVSDHPDAPGCPAVPVDDVLGRVSFRYWPLHRIGWVR